MKRPVRQSSSGDSNTRLAGTPPQIAATEIGVKFSAVFKKATLFAGEHFFVMSAAAFTPPARVRPAILAGDLRNETELSRLKPIVESVTAKQTNRFVLVAGIDSDRILRSSSERELRRAMEVMGAIFVERPAEADTPEALAAFLDDKYAPDPEAIEAALAPLPPIAVLENHDISPYLEPRPAIPGDQ